ncbi:HAD family hydrolase [Actinoplanes sp. NPDC004185]
MKAVVFDFFGTLTDPSAEAGRLASFTATAAALGVPADAFRTTMAATFRERATGAFGDTRATLRAVALRCGVDPAPDALDAATAVQLAGAATVRTPRPGGLAVLATLRERGLRLGLISDCSSELYESWPSTPFAPLIDAAVFSWREGYRKPDQRLYATVAERLGVLPQQCWYVGDGGSREHWGAATAGMRPVLVTNASYPSAAAYRDDPDTHVPELAVDELSTLLPLICQDHSCP